MEKASLNVIIFDEDEPSVKDHRESRCSKQAGSSSSHNLEIIEQEIQYLTDKIRSLENQAESLVHLKNESNVSNRVSATKGDLVGGERGEIIMIMERKMQIIVSETRRIVDKLGETFEKKLLNQIGNKCDESGISKIRQNYSDEVRKIEDGYRKEIERINREHKEQEKRMLARLTAIEQNVTNRINQFHIKEKEYIDWIHHLETQLQDKPKEPKYKKMIEVTHAPKNSDPNKKDHEQNSSILTGDNYSALHPSKSNNSQIQESSKIQRRHRIFDAVGAKSSSSVSPNSKVVSPISAQPVHTYSSKVINPISSRPEAESKKQTEMQSVNPQSRQTEVSYQSEKPGLVIERMTEPLKMNYNERESSPWKVMDTCSVEKSHGDITKRKEIAKDVNASEFYKDIPQANQGWEGFQNYQ